AYQNDVLTALARTGGLPDLDAYNEVIIYRDGLRIRPEKPDVVKQLENAKPGPNLHALDAWFGETIHIPLRLPAGAAMPFHAEDVQLRNGDVVFLEARDEQIFFTAGLLPPGKHVLPRDRDLDVREAVAVVHGSLYNGAFGGRRAGYRGPGPAARPGRHPELGPVIRGGRRFLLDPGALVRYRGQVELPIGRVDKHRDKGPPDANHPARSPAAGQAHESKPPS